MSIKALIEAYYGYLKQLNEKAEKKEHDDEFDTICRNLYQNIQTLRLHFRLQPAHEAIEEILTNASQQISDLVMLCEKVPIVLRELVGMAGGAAFDCFGHFDEGAAGQRVSGEMHDYFSDIDEVEALEIEDDGLVFVAEIDDESKACVMRKM
jgi:hypothetical protein